MLGFFTPFKNTFGRSEAKPQRSERLKKKTNSSAVQLVAKKYWHPLFTNRHTHEQHAPFRHVLRRWNTARMLSRQVIGSSEGDALAVCQRSSLTNQLTLN